jgi:hypothetical protein
MTRTSTPAFFLPMTAAINFGSVNVNCLIKSGVFGRIDELEDRLHTVVGFDDQMRRERQHGVGMLTPRQ